jgi:integrase
MTQSIARSEPTKVRLTKTIVDDLTPLLDQEGTPKEGVVWDDRQPGFGVRISPTGVKTYIAMFRVHGVLKKANLGRTDRTPLDTAKRDAAKMLGDAARHIDPLAGRATRASKTVAELWPLFIEAKRFQSKPNTIIGYAQVFDLYLEPKLGRRKIASIERADIEAVKKHYGALGQQATANKAIAAFSSFISWCRAEGHYHNVNPCSRTLVERFDVPPRTNYLKPEQLARLRHALDTTQANPFAVAAIRLILALGLRIGEVLQLRWDCVDLGANVIQIPHAKGKPRTVHLNTTARAVLATLPRLGDNPHVIPGSVDGAHMQNIRKPFARILKEAGIDAATRHDLRRTFGSMALQAGMPMAEVAGLLGHSSVKVTERVYAFLGDPALKAAAAKADAAMNAAMSGDATALNVVPMTKRTA